MDILISAEIAGESNEAELRSLRDWLRQESPRPGRVELQAPVSAPGTMGPASEALQVALGAGGAGTVLAGSVSVWLQTRRPTVRLRLRRADGSELEVDGRVKNAEALIQRFLEAPPADEP